MKISDYGISKIVRGSHSATSGLGVSVLWASPQQYVEGGQVGRKAHVFSLRLIYVFMLFKREGKKKVEKILRADNGFGFFPGKLRNGMEKVVKMAMGIHGGDVFQGATP